MASVTLRNVTKRYDGHPHDAPAAVTDLSLEVADREFLVLVGPSGCGKSTTLRMIAGLESVTEGAIEIGGKRVNEVAPKDRDIAMVFQNYALYPHMTVAQNLGFALKLRKVKPTEIDRRIREAAAILGIEELLERLPKTLSGGQRQRVAVGRAIVRQPKVFLFDEPLSNLDAKLRNQMRGELMKLHQQIQTTMIYVTHDQVEAMTMGHRIVVMSGGIIQQADTPKTVYREPTNQFVAGFLGSPPMNFIRGRIRPVKKQQQFVEEGDGSLRYPVSPEWATHLGEQPLVLGIRPEDLVPTPKDAPGSEEPFPTVVELVEPMGAETLLHVQTGAHSLIVRVMEMLGQEDAGRRMRFRFKPGRVQFFDPTSGRRIELPAPVV